MIKLFYRITFIIIAITVCNVSYAQKNRPAVIEDVDESLAWVIVYESFKKHNKKLYNYNKQTQTAKSGFYQYTSMLVENRAKYQVTYKNGNIEIKFVERQYLSKEGWVNNLLPLSKKTQKKYIYPIASTIRELLNEKNKYAKKIPENNQKSTKSVTEQKPLSGIYDNFAIIKTDNPKMQLLAIHKDGSMIGFNLTEDKKRVISVTFKKDLNSPDFVMFFDYEGNPKGAGFGDYVYVFQKAEGDQYKSLTYDKNGNCINKSKIELAHSSEIDQIIDPDKKSKGPNPGNVFISVITFKELNDWIQDQSEILNVVSCAIALPTGLGAIGPCGTLIISEILKELPENHVYYDELVLAKELLSFITFSTPTSFFDKFSTIVGAMAASSDKINTLIEEYFPTKVLIAPKPFIETTEKEYNRTNGVATIILKYSKFITNKNKTISLYKINTDKSFSFYDEYTVLNNQGEAKFDIPFNGDYEARVLYDNELKNKVQFSVVGDNVASTSKFCNFMCMDVQFAGSIHKDFYLNNEKYATMIHHFSIETTSCSDGRISPYGTLKPIEIEWSGNTFYATTTKKSGVSTVIYSINGTISNNGNNLEHIKMKTISTWTSYNNMASSKETKEVTLENIPFNHRQSQFTIYSSPEALKNIKYLKHNFDYDKPENNSSSNNIEKEGYKMAREGSFIFHLKFFKSWRSQ